MVEGFSKDWVCVYFGQPPVAELLAQVLESAGIAAHVPDSNLRASDALGIGGPTQFLAEVYVPRADRERALEVLARNPTDA